MVNSHVEAIFVSNLNLEFCNFVSNILIQCQFE